MEKRRFVQDETDEVLWDNDLLGDENDRFFLNSLTEVEREQILMERFEIRKAKRLRLSSGGRVDEAARQKERIERDRKEKERREKEKELESAREKEREKERERLERKIREQEEEERVLNPSSDSSEDEEEKRKNMLTFEDMKHITFTRNAVLNIKEKDFFEDVIIGSYVRVSIGSKNEKTLYRVCEVVGFKYKEVTNSTHRVERKLVLSLRQPSLTRPKDFAIDLISNGELTEEEYTFYVNLALKKRASVLSTDDAKFKFESNRMKLEHIVDEREVIEKLKKKPIKKNTFQKRTELEELLEQAKRSENIEKIQQITEQLDALKRADRPKRLNVSDYLARKAALEAKQGVKYETGPLINTAVGFNRIYASSMGYSGVNDDDNEQADVEPQAVVQKKHDQSIDLFETLKRIHDFDVEINV